MKLTNFSVENFRSITSSGDIPTEELTALVGRNESGKSNLLLALETVNPIGGKKDIDPVKNFPRGRNLTECNPKTAVVNTIWELDAEQTQELSKVLADHGPVNQVQLVRYYAAEQVTVDLLGVETPVLDPAKVASLVRRVMPVVDAVVANISEPHLEPAKAAIQAVTDTVNKQDDLRAWGQAVVQACKALRSAIGAGGVALEEAPDQLLAELEHLATKLSTFEAAQGKAKALVLGWLPTFIYIADFPELSGHQNFLLII